MTIPDGATFPPSELVRFSTIPNFFRIIDIRSASCTWNTTALAKPKFRVYRPAPMTTKPREKIAQEPKIHRKQGTISPISCLIVMQQNPHQSRGSTDTDDASACEFSPYRFGRHTNHGGMIISSYWIERHLVELYHDATYRPLVSAIKVGLARTSSIAVWSIKEAWFQLFLTLHGG